MNNVSVCQFDERLVHADTVNVGIQMSPRLGGQSQRPGTVVHTKNKIDPDPEACTGPCPTSRYIIAVLQQLEWTNTEERGGGRVLITRLGTLDKLGKWRWSGGLVEKGCIRHGIGFYLSSMIYSCGYRTE